MLKIVKKWAADYLLDEQRKPNDVKSLQFAFVDSKGKRYYTWPDFAELPKCRMDQVQNFATYHDAKLTKENIQTLADEIARLGLKVVEEKNEKQLTKYHSQIQVLCAELKFRDDYISPENTFYNFTAVLCCREDEMPNEFNAKIHDEKVMQFQKEGRNGNSFFLKLPILKELLPGFYGTSEQWSKVLEKWASDQLRMATRLKTILSER